MITTLISVVVFFLMYYYPLVVLLIFRNSSPATRFLIALVIHPIVVELLVSGIRLGQGKSKTVHVFYEHLTSFMLGNNVFILFTYLLS